jgi:hypothetical protein
VDAITKPHHVEGLSTLLEHLFRLVELCLGSAAARASTASFSTSTVSFVTFSRSVCQSLKRVLRPGWQLIQALAEAFKIFSPFSVVPSSMWQAIQLARAVK